MTIKYSNYQQAIFDWVSAGSGNAVVNAVAGSGKTTTSVKAIESVQGNVRCLAFNKSIMKVLQEKTIGMFNVECINYNAFGNQLLRKVYPYGKCKFNQNKTDYIFRYKVLNGQEANLFYKWRNPIKKIIGIMKGMGLVSTPTNTTYLSIMDYHDIEIKQSEINRFLDCLESTWKIASKDRTQIDFDDQLYIPVVENMVIPKVEFVLVDEFQDTNYIQSRLIGQPDRIMVVGDPYQAIYGFRGSTPDAMGQFAKERSMVSLPLSICYRCPKVVVAEAKKIVSHIEAWDMANEGTVDQITKIKFQGMINCHDHDKTIVICRTNAPLVENVLWCIRKGIPAFVKGKEVKEQLIALMEKIGVEETDFPGRIRAYRESQSEVYNSLGKEDKIDQLEDLCKTLEVLYEDTGSLSGVLAKLAIVFPEDSGDEYGLPHMSIHKAKGLEAWTVFWLIGGKMRQMKKEWQMEEERRLAYVATTRAMGELYYVNYN